MKHTHTSLMDTHEPVSLPGTPHTQTHILCRDFIKNFTWVCGFSYLSDVRFYVPHVPTVLHPQIELSASWISRLSLHNSFQMSYLT